MPDFHVEKPVFVVTVHYMQIWLHFMYVLLIIVYLVATINAASEDKGEGLRLVSSVLDCSKVERTSL